MIAAYCDHKLIAPFTVEGACNRTVFETWIETCLIKCLKPGQWLVIDNATFHKGGRITELIEQSGCQVLYLPPYSPDFNKIERCWSWLKHRIRQCLNEFDCLRSNGAYFKACVLTLVATAISIGWKYNRSIRRLTS
jgi:transposase